MIGNPYPTTHAKSEVYRVHKLHLPTFIQNLKVLHCKISSIHTKIKKRKTHIPLKQAKKSLKVKKFKKKCVKEKSKKSSNLQAHNH